MNRYETLLDEFTRQMDAGRLASYQECRTRALRALSSEQPSTRDECFNIMRMVFLVIMVRDQDIVR